MDKEYIVTITEVLQRKVRVKAPDKDEAKYIVEQQYYNQEHILNETDLKIQSFKAKAA